MVDKMENKLGGERVLIVDDSAELRASLEAILLYGGYESVSAATGQEGYSLALKVRPDVILLDLELPDTTGLKLLEEFNRQGLTIPTVMMTGYGSEGTAARALRLGVRDYLVKPFTTEEVLSSIDRALQEGRLRRETERLKALADDYTQCLDLLYAIGSSITSDLNLDDVLQRIVEAGGEITGAEQGFLLQLNRKSREINVVAAWGSSEHIGKAFSVQAGDKRLHPVLREGIAMRLQASEGRTIKIQTGDMAAAILQVPLKMCDRVVGVLTMQRREDNLAFDERHERMLSVLAGYAVIALERAGRVA
jgi:two-component system NtrC family sensor kinase